MAQRILRTKYCKCGALGVIKEPKRVTSRCPECTSRMRRKTREANPLATILNWAKSRRPGCNLTVDYLKRMFKKQGGRCYWFGVPLLLVPGDNPLAKVSIDRLDNGRGYIQGNVVLACMAANFARNQYAVGEFKTLIASIDLRRAPVSAPPASRVVRSSKPVAPVSKRRVRRLSRAE